MDHRAQRLAGRGAPDGGAPIAPFTSNVCGTNVPIHYRYPSLRVCVGGPGVGELLEGAAQFVTVLAGALGPEDQPAADVIRAFIMAKAND